MLPLRDFLSYSELTSMPICSVDGPLPVFVKMLTPQTLGSAFFGLCWLSLCIASVFFLAKICLQFSEQKRPYIAQKRMKGAVDGLIAPAVSGQLVPSVWGWHVHALSAWLCPPRADYVCADPAKSLQSVGWEYIVRQLNSL